MNRLRLGPARVGDHLPMMINDDRKAPITKVPGINPRWLRQRIADGRLAAYRSGHDDRVVLVDLDELAELLRVRPA